MTGQHELEFEERGPVLLATLAGEVDTANVSVVRSELLRRGADQVLVLDLRDVDYLDSAGIAMLESLRRATELRLVLDRGSIVERAITIVGFDQVLAVYPSPDAAVDATPR